MKKSILFLASTLLICGAPSCSKKGGYKPPKSLTVSSPNADVEVTNKEMDEWGNYHIYVKCLSPDRYFLEGLLSHNHIATYDGKEHYLTPKRLSLTEIQYDFFSTDIGGKDLAIVTTLGEGTKTFDQFRFTGSFALVEPPLEATPFTISVFEETKTFTIKKLRDIDDWEFTIHCYSSLLVYGSCEPYCFTDKEWNKIEVDTEITITFSWATNNKNFETGPIDFDGYKPM